MNVSLPPFISVDGIDGVGKSTQINAIGDLLDELDVPFIKTRDPGSSEIGKRLRSLLLDSDLQIHRRTEALLFMASRCEMVETVIHPTLKSGTAVVSDRFLLANVVYQSISKDGDGVPAELLWKLGNLANGGVRPNLTILLDMPAVDAMKRIDGAGDRMESRGVEYMESVRQAFLEHLPSASETTLVIDASKPAADVTREIDAKLRTFLSSR